jgi:PAS domain S-box-containing protein
MFRSVATLLWVWAVPWALVSAQGPISPEGAPGSLPSWLPLALAGLVLLVLTAAWALSLRRQVRRHRQAEAALGRSESQYRQLFVRSPKPMFIVDAETLHLLAVNDAALDQYGWSHAEFLGLTLADLDPAAELAPVPQTPAGHPGRPLAQLDVRRHRRKDGSQMQVDICASHIRFDGRPARLCVMQDVTSQRRQVDEQLRRHQELLQTIIDNSNAVIFVKDLEGRYLTINRRYAERFRVSNAGLQGHTDHDLFPAEVADAMRATDQEVIRTGRPLEYEEAVPQGDALHTYLSHKFPLYDRDGQLYAVCGIATDISERNRAAEELRIGTERLCLALEAAEAGSWAYCLDTGENIWDERIPVLVALPPDQADPARWRDFVHPEDRAALDAAVAAACAPGAAPLNVEFRVRRRDGVERWFSDRGFVLQRPDGARWMYGVLQDISARVMRERQLMASEQRFQDIVAASSDWVWEVDAAYRYTFVSDGVRNLLGYQATELLGKTPFDLMPADEAGRVRGVFAAIVAQRRPFRDLENLNRHKDGHLLQVQTNGVPILDGAGALVGYRGLDRDVTAHKITLANLEQARQAAEAANLAKSAFLANMSHEIRTPLNAISGMAQLIRHEGLTPKQVERMDKLDGASRHLADVINDILDLAKIESGQFDLEATEIDLYELVKEVVGMLQEQIQAKQLQLTLEISPSQGQFRGDPARLQQALRHYVSNAVKFTDRGSIRVRLIPQDRNADGRLLRFEVEDTGIGIAPEVLPRLFAPFEQADNSSTRAYGGTGLGLVITRKIARLMDGDAGATSVLGQGSRFWFTARLRELDDQLGAPGQTTTLSAADILSRDYPGRRILLADDDPFNREIVRFFLEEVSQQVDTAPDGSAAVELARGNRYDLILLDIRMPNMTGLEATRHIRALPNAERVPIIAVTGDVFAEDRATWHAAGMDDLIAKPIRPDELFGLLLKWLRRGSGPCTVSDLRP